MKNLLLIAFGFIPTFFFAQTSINCDSILQTSTCAGGNVIINFQTTGSFPWGNVFTAELSDNWGNWGNPQVLGTTMFTIGGNGIIFGNIPANVNFGFLYRVRVVSSNPADTSNDSPNTLIITQVAQLNQIVSNPGDSACPGDTITLYALNPAVSYQWSTGDTAASIQVTQSGAYSVTTTDLLTCQSTAYDTIVFDASMCTGINEITANEMLHVYPNPAQGEINIRYDALYADAWFEISDITGRILLKQEMTGANFKLDVSSFSTGIYLVSVHSGTGISNRKLIIE